jgi:LPS O-antigen subunit length determinant protein (WzzB/FepE family)
MEKKSSLIKDEIDFSYFFRLIKKNKILITSLSILFTVLAYSYQANQPRELQLQFKIRPAPPLILINYHMKLNDSYLNFTNDLVKTIYEQYNNSLTMHLLSLDNLEEFISQDKKIDNFKNFLKLNNISSKEYFNKKLTQIPNLKNIDDRYSLKFRLIFPKELDGSVFVSNYLEFIKNKTINEYKDSIRIALKDYDKQLYDALEIAKTANIENPTLTSKFDVNFDYKQKELFYQGTKVLSSKITINKKAIDDLNNFDFNYKILIEKSNPKQHSKSEYAYALAGFIFSIFLSILIIFLRYLILKYN